MYVQRWVWHSSELFSLSDTAEFMAICYVLIHTQNKEILERKKKLWAKYHSGQCKQRQYTVDIAIGASCILHIVTHVRTSNLFCHSVSCGRGTGLPWSEYNRYKINRHVGLYCLLCKCNEGHYFGSEFRNMDYKKRITLDHLDRSWNGNTQTLLDMKCGCVPSSTTNNNGDFLV